MSKYIQFDGLFERAASFFLVSLGVVVAGATAIVGV
jgi:hypothetical protein